MVLAKTTHLGEPKTVKTILLHLKGVLIAVVALALSAGLAFGAQAPSGASSGLASAGSHSTKTVKAAGDEASGDEDADTDEDTEVDESTEDADTDEDTEVDETTDESTDETTDETTGVDETVDAAGDNCATDPTALTVEELAAMSHGSIVCWAAHQTTWPAEFKNHGAWVSSWAHMGNDNAAKANGKIKAHKTKP